MHEIEYRSYEEHVKRNDVQYAIDDYISVNADYGSELIRWLDDIAICANENEAKKTIEANDKGWYDALAVRYYEPDMDYSDAETEVLDAAVAAAKNEYHFLLEPWVKTLPQKPENAFITCPQCKSSVKREYIYTNKCPVCHKDIRPQAEIDKEINAKHNLDEFEDERLEYYRMRAPKNVNWLVKFEYHI